MLQEDIAIELLTPAEFKSFPLIIGDDIETMDKYIVDVLKKNKANTKFKNFTKIYASNEDISLHEDGQYVGLPFIDKYFKYNSLSELVNYVKEALERKEKFFLYLNTRYKVRPDIDPENKWDNKQNDAKYLDELLTLLTNAKMECMVIKKYEDENEVVSFMLERLIKEVFVFTLGKKNTHLKGITKTLKLDDRQKMVHIKNGMERDMPFDRNKVSPSYYVTLPRSKDIYEDLVCNKALTEELKEICALNAMYKRNVEVAYWPLPLEQKLEFATDRGCERVYCANTQVKTELVNLILNEGQKISSEEVEVVVVDASSELKNLSQKFKNVYCGQEETQKFAYDLYEKVVGRIERLDNYFNGDVIKFRSYHAKKIILINGVDSEEIIYPINLEKLHNNPLIEMVVEFGNILGLHIIFLSNERPTVSNNVDINRRIMAFGLNQTHPNINLTIQDVENFSVDMYTLR
ncbi:MAG: hypothetical protein ATN36_06270 [Epulopiscium sp. Nele67-Bin005]|nr:MAG: hypothetical protein ATN36_06270 [Epulopiscium sp. Nele67-Bin005]